MASGVPSSAKDSGASEYPSRLYSALRKGVGSPPVRSASSAAWSSSAGVSSSLGERKRLCRLVEPSTPTAISARWKVTTE